MTTTTKSETESPAKAELREFLRKHHACSEGYEWAVENCDSLSDVWDRAKPEWLIWIATREGVLSDRDLRLFACWSVRQVWDQLTDDRSRNAVAVAERYARGEATDSELAAASAAAWDAAWDATRAAAYADAEVGEEEEAELV